jgi:hypothetical protein
MPQNALMLQQARTAAENAVAKVVSELGDTQPPTVKVTAMNGFAAQELINALCDADLLVVGSRGKLGFPALRIGATSTKIAITRAARLSSCRPPVRKSRAPACTVVQARWPSASAEHHHSCRAAAGTT